MRNTVDAVRIRIKKTSTNNAYFEMRTKHYEWYKKVIQTAEGLVIDSKAELEVAAKIEERLMKFTLGLLDALDIPSTNRPVKTAEKVSLSDTLDWQPEFPTIRPQT